MAIEVKSVERLQRMCVDDSASLRDCLAAIERGGCEIAIVVSGSDRVTGVLTDGDVRRGILAGRALDEGIGDLARKDFRWVSDGGNHRADALDLMRNHSVQQVPVLDPAGRLVGLHRIEEFLEAEPLPNQAIVLAGGKGTRLRPFTEHVPKPMLKVAGRPILERLVMALVGAGISDILISVNYRKEMIMDHFGDGAHHGCAIRYIEESRPMGTGGPLSLISPPADPVVLMNGDLVGDFRFRELLQHHQNAQSAITMGVGLHSYSVPYGVVNVDRGRVTEVVEKPTHSWWVNYGVYAISPSVWEAVPPDHAFPVTDLIDECIARGWPVGGFEVEGEWHDVGRPEDLEKVRGFPQV